MPLPIEYSLRSLWVRRASTLATVGSIALVVFVLASSQMLAEGLKRTLGVSGSRDKAIVLQQGATAEAYSRIPQSAVRMAAGAPGVRLDSNRTPQLTGESIVPVLLPRTDDPSNIVSVFVRGVEESSLRLRPNIRIIEGRLPKFGTDEAMVGSKLLGRYRGLTLGGALEIKIGRKISIVGVFEAGGAAYESEIWADREAVRNSLNWIGYFSSATVQLASAKDFPAFASELKLVSNGEIVTERESDYYARISKGLSALFLSLGGLVAIIFSFGAMLGAAITMYSSISQRTKEIGVFRAMGFHREDILKVFLLEAGSVSLLGAALGLGLALTMSFVELSTLNTASGTEITFQFVAVGTSLLGSFLVGAFIGILGGLFPAIKASRMNPLEAIRS